MRTSQKDRLGDGFSSQELNFLNPDQVIMIDEALTALGDYGEVRLIIEKGRLRYLVTQKSFDALKWQAGSMAGEAR
jgi:hypothetical protein